MSCPVGPSALDGELVRCGDCRTSRHGDCWRYVGRCSVYGCRGRSA